MKEGEVTYRKVPKYNFYDEYNSSLMNTKNQHLSDVFTVKSWRAQLPPVENVNTM